ncbi:hypothetical protein [Mesorhizobium sp. CO1-1-8]|uniref:hypothetical protein n=1 Tax=Mesorhizobium sp. CO1-1-8 TaxID=2876631 RepID=UPI001CD0F100|nr:hypothetical protein [Mesorhizobium sp. CO1-1-8]MBZ9775049.1 hypothetical protein [Mesorhizobium sp. CO1-1-8]
MAMSLLRDQWLETLGCAQPMHVSAPTVIAQSASPFWTDTLADLQKLQTSAVVLGEHTRRFDAGMSGGKTGSAAKEILSGWAQARQRNISQRQFWRFFDYIRSADLELQEAGTRFVGIGELVDCSVDSCVTATVASGMEVCSLLASMRMNYIAVIDGQHSVSAMMGALDHDLSQRAIREIIANVLDEIADRTFERPRALLTQIHWFLTFEIARRIKIRWRPVFAFLPDAEFQGTRAWVLNFQLRTGTPPPALFDRCLGAGRVPMTYAMRASTRLENATLRRRRYRRDLLDPVRAGHRRAYYGQGTQDLAAACRRADATGRWRTGARSALEIRSRQTWRACGGQMAPHIPMGRGRGPVRNPVRTTLTGTRCDI